MLKHPRLKYCYHAEFVDHENVLLTSEKDTALLTGKLYSRVLFAIQHNSLSVDDLSRKLEDEISIFELYYALEVLEKKGYITEAVPSLPQETCAYWNSLGIEIPSLLKVLEEKTITLETRDLVTRDVFMEAFATIGIQTHETGVLTVVITDDYEREELHHINREAMETKQPWMLVKPVGAEIWIGPLFLPGKTGCYECLKQRFRLNRQINTFGQTQQHTKDYLYIPVIHIPLSLQIAANQTVIEIVKWLYFGKNEVIEGKVVTFDTQTSTSRSHVLVKRPQCKTCGNIERLESKPIILKKRASYCASTLGGYKEMTPEDVVEKYQYHVSPITGVVQKLEPYHTIKDSPIHNYLAGRNIAFQSKNIFLLNNQYRSANGGKGTTWSQAKAGALCEAIERYSVTYHGDEPYIISSLEKLGSKGIHPNACMNFSEKQYQNREEFNQACHKFYFFVPVPFDESRNMPWTPVYSITEQEFKYLPSCFCYMQYPTEEDDYHLFAYPDANGCAAGSTIEEAILHGFLELVERDSVAIWWYNKLRKPTVDLLSFNKPYFLQVMEFYKSLNRGVYVLDVTSDLQIPSFAAISHCLDDKKEDIVMGFGAHVDVKIAVERALIELNQIFPVANVSKAEKDKGQYKTPDKDFLNWLNTATMKNQLYLVPLDNELQKTASDYPQLCEPNIYDSVVFCINTAAEHGLETLVLDMTRPDVSLPVVRVFVPSLRHFWKRLAPGRLYDVPVKMGWLNASLKEEELNPIALFI